MVESKKLSVKNISQGLIGYSYTKASSVRGNLLHSIRTKFLTQALKTGNKIQTNHTLYAQKLQNLSTEILETTRINESFKEFTHDINDLLKNLCKEIIKKSKDISFQTNNKFTPEQVEVALFGGIVQFEEFYSAEYDGDEIKGIVDQIVYISQDTFKIGEFKTCLMDSDKDPSNPESKNYHDWEQAALYAFVVEEQSQKKCLSFKLIFHPNKETPDYEFTDEIKIHVQNLIEERRFEALDFKISSKTKTTFDIKTEEAGSENIEIEFIQPNNNQEKFSADAVNPSYINQKPSRTQEIGFLSTTKDKPFQLKRGGENRMEGFLWANRAAMVKDGYYIAVEKEDGIRIVSLIEEIKSWEGTITGDIASHHEEVYYVKLNPKYEMLPEGPQYPRPQTIPNGKIMLLEKDEYYLMNRLPKFGMKLGNLEDGNEGEYDYNYDPKMFFQSVFVGGVQGTGKTTALKQLILTILQQPNAPAIVVFDAEGEFAHLDKIPTSNDSAVIMSNNCIKPLNPQKFSRIVIEEFSGECLTLASIDPIQLHIFLDELASKTYTQFQRIIQDIKYANPNRQFTFPDLRTEITNIMNINTSYRLHTSVRDAIQRALQNIALDLFDMPNRIPLDVKKMLQPGKVTVIDTYNLRDEQQRIVALYILTLFHQYNMKRKKSEDATYPGVLLFLDEVQRILPENSSNSEYQNRIIGFLSEIHHRGRKKDYGIIYATQSPADIKKVIINLCNTKMFFQIRGSLDFMKEYLNKYEIEDLKRLPDGVAFITCKGKHEPVMVRFPFIS